MGYLWNGETGNKRRWVTEFDGWEIYNYFADMNAPAVSLILPAYNCEKFIGGAIQSVLDQTFTDFELIIINDGSADQTEFIILSYTDLRITYLKNKNNQGLIYTLNRGINIAQGKYIARMDADDICIPERLELQKKFLDQHEKIAMVASTVEFINEENNFTGEWELDKKTITPKQIRAKMPYENCIAHPTIMARTEVLKKLKYDERQKHIEDYDLWLRMLNRGYQIEKLNQPLLKYRVHDKSVTGVFLKKKNPFFLLAKMKIKCLYQEVFTGHFSGFSILIKFGILTDIVKGIAKSIKRIIIK